VTGGLGTVEAVWRTTREGWFSWEWGRIHPGIDRAGQTGPVDTDTVDSPTDGELAFSCPRCASEVTAAYYGPCDTCRATLRATVDATARDIEAAEYEPRMNVTPNAVATKE